jgi:hypothetical protein
MLALRKMFFAAQVPQLFRIRQCPKMEMDARASTFILSDHRYSRRILNLPPVGNCPGISPSGASAATRSGTLETANLAQNQVKSQVK